MNKTAHFLSLPQPCSKGKTQLKIKHLFQCSILHVFTFYVHICFLKVNFTLINYAYTHDKRCVEEHFDMFSPMKSTSWCLSNAIIINSTPVFFTSSTFVCGFWNIFFYFKSTQESCAHVYYFPSISSKYLNALVMRIMYHQTD